MKFRILVLAYLSALLSSAGLGWIFYTGFLDVSKNTLGLEALRTDWEYLSLSEAARIFSDFLGDFGVKATLYLLVLHIFQLFFTAGLLDAVMRKRLRFRRFLIQGLRRTPFFFGLHLLLSSIALLFLTLLLFLGWAIHKNLSLPDHRNVFLSYALPVLVFVCIFLFLYMLWDYARLYLVRGKRLIPSLKAGFRTILKHRTTWRYFGLFLGAMLLSTLLYRLASPLLYPLLFIAQQAFLFLRVYIRWTYLQHIAQANPLEQ